MCIHLQCLCPCHNCSCCSVVGTPGTALSMFTSEYQVPLLNRILKAHLDHSCWLTASWVHVGLSVLCYPSACLPLQTADSLSFLSVCLFVCLSANLLPPICLFILSVCLSIYASVCLLRLSVCLSPGDPSQGHSTATQVEVTVHLLARPVHHLRIVGFIVYLQLCRHSHWQVCCRFWTLCLEPL